MSDLDSFSLAHLSGIILFILKHPISTFLAAQLPVCVWDVLSAPNYVLYLTLPIVSGSFSTSRATQSRTTRLNARLKASSQHSFWCLPPRESQVISKEEDGSLSNTRQMPG